MKYTTYFNLHHKLQRYKTSWPLKDVTGNTTPLGPHVGLWEQAVKSMAYHLRRTMRAHRHQRRILYPTGRDKVTPKIQPLCALSNDPVSPKKLRPGHFLINEP